MMPNIKTVACSAALMLATISPSLRAQTLSITGYAEYHTSIKASASSEKIQPWQAVDLNVTPLGDGEILSWRQWGGNQPNANYVHYDGTQGAASEPVRNAISDITGYDPANTYVGDDSKFLVTYKNAKIRDQIKDDHNLVFAFDSLTFSVPADAKSKILRLWAGAYACDGEIDVDLRSSAGDVLASYSKTITCLSPSAGPSDPDHFYSYWRFRFQGTGPDQILYVRWHSLHRFQNNANVALQAAVLTSAGVTSPAR